MAVEDASLHSHRLSESPVLMEEIIIWESRVETLCACEIAVSQALKELGLKAKIIVNAEPPLISRNQLWERLPVLELRGLRWSLHPGRPFTKEQLLRLFQQVLIASEHTDPEDMETDP